MKDIMLKITGKTVTENVDKEEQEDVVEFVTEGKLFQRDDAMMISYPESDLSGMEGWTTYLTFKGNRIKLKRSSSEGSEPNTEMEFEPGVRYDGKYETPYGSLNVELLTNSISPFIEDEQGNRKMTIDYSVCLHGFTESRNTLDIEILNN